jgi:hypothetical protein
MTFAWQDAVVGFAPAVAWSAIWIQFVAARFFDKPEVIFKDWIDSGAKDRAISNIDSSKLIPALAQLCDSVGDLKASKAPDELLWLSTVDILMEVDFLEHLEKAEAALREKERIEHLFDRLKGTSGLLWKLSLLHCLSVVLIPTSLLIPDTLWRIVPALFTGIIAIGTLIVLVAKIVSFQKMRDEFLTSLAANRKVADA